MCVACADIKEGTSTKLKILKWGLSHNFIACIRKNDQKEVFCRATWNNQTQTSRTHQGIVGVFQKYHSVSKKRKLLLFIWRPGEMPSAILNNECVYVWHLPKFWLVCQLWIKAGKRRHYEKRSRCRNHYRWMILHLQLRGIIYKILIWFLRNQNNIYASSLSASPPSLYHLLAQNITCLFHHINSSLRNPDHQPSLNHSI